MSNKIKVIIVEPNEAPVVKEIENDVKTFQKIVGGFIEVFDWYSDPIAIICNEEGKFNGSLPNRVIDCDIIFGTFIVVGLTDDKFSTLTDDLTLKYTQKFIEPDRFSVGRPSHQKGI